jgi:hypothetical protein
MVILYNLHRKNLDETYLGKLSNTLSARQTRGGLGRSCVPDESTDKEEFVGGLGEIKKEVR